MKRVLFLTHSLDKKRGSGRFTSGIVEHLAAMGRYDIRVLTTLASGASLEEAILAPRLWKLLLQLPSIRRAIKEADLVHALDIYPYGLIATLMSLGLKKKLIITAIGSSSVQPLHTALAPFVRYALLHASAVTAISAYVGRRINEQIPGLRIVIAIPGVDFDYFVRASAPERPHARPYILSVAKVKARKGVEISLRAFAKIADQFPHVDYINIGVFRGDAVPKTEALIRQLGIQDRVFFKQRIPDQELIALYRHAELFILLPQNSGDDIEGFGLVYVEAASFGLPVIGALDSGAEDAVADNGYLVAPKDVDAAAARIAEILSNSALRARLSERSIEFAKTLDWKKAITKYSALYELLLK